MVKYVQNNHNMHTSKNNIGKSKIKYVYLIVYVIPLLSLYCRCSSLTVVVRRPVSFCHSRLSYFVVVVVRRRRLLSCPFVRRRPPSVKYLLFIRGGCTRTLSTIMLWTALVWSRRLLLARLSLTISPNQARVAASLWDRFQNCFLLAVQLLLQLIKKKVDGS